MSDSLDASITVETPEQISLSYSLAGIGSRATAAFIDFVFCMLVYIGISILFSLIPSPETQSNFSSPTWAIVFFLVLQFLLQWGYYVLCEGLFDGQTIGKRLIRLRTVSDGGHAITFTASAVRNLMRVLDMQPYPTYFIGIVSALMSKSGKRLGDLVAGTFVVRENIPVPHAGGKDDSSVATDIPVSWVNFSKQTASMRSRGLAHVPASEVSSFVADYRRLTTEYAQLRTSSKGKLTGNLFYLSRLISNAHSVLYRQQSRMTQSIVQYIVRDVPAEIRRSWRPICLAAVLLFGPAIATYAVVTTHPETARRVMPDEMMSRASMATEREQRGEGYVTVTPDEQPLLASFVTLNNIKVMFYAFAAGLTAGILTVYVLITNGVMLGAVFAIFSLENATRVALAFIAPHGVLELTAICIGAGAGLLIAHAIWLPGKRTRRDALVYQGKRAIQLVSGAILLLVVAGILEGMVSPLVWPLSHKLLVSGATAVLLVAYLMGSMRARSTALEHSGQSELTTTPGL